MQTGLAVFLLCFFFVVGRTHLSDKIFTFVFFFFRLFCFGPKFSDSVILLFLLICFSPSGKNPRPEAISRHFNWESNYGISVPFLFFFFFFFKISFPLLCGPVPLPPPPPSNASLERRGFFPPFLSWCCDFCEQCSLRDRGPWSTTLDEKKPQMPVVTWSPGRVAEIWLFTTGVVSVVFVSWGLDP